MRVENLGQRGGLIYRVEDIHVKNDRRWPLDSPLLTCLESAALDPLPSASHTLMARRLLRAGLLSAPARPLMTRQSWEGVARSSIRRRSIPGALIMSHQDCSETIFVVQEAQ